MKKKICSFPSCNELIDHKEARCQKHTVKRIPFENAVRTNSHLYNTVKWRKLRKQVLKETPYCFSCGIGIKEATLEIHHLTPPKGNEELFFDINNLSAVCQLCHKAITAREIKRT
jgi:5-methylcytosine-specific restriction protein A